MRWFQFQIGFSFIGLLFLLCLFVPNILFALREPAWQSGMAAAEPKMFLIPERVGQICVCVLILFTRNLRLPTEWSLWALWLMAAGGLMVLYLICWGRYFAGSGTARSFYGPVFGIPIPLATLPVAAVLLLGIYARSFWLILAGAVLGFGHVGIHAVHMAAAQAGKG